MEGDGNIPASLWMLITWNIRVVRGEADRGEGGFALASK